MALISWSDNMSVGVAKIDKEHKGLIDLINLLHSEMLAGKSKDALGTVLDKLIVYTKTHFAAEEGMLNATKYPGLTAHQLKHRDLIKQVEEYASRYEKGEITLNLHLLNFLGDWLTNHIQKIDREYGPWLNEHGVK